MNDKQYIYVICKFVFIIILIILLTRYIMTESLNKEDDSDPVKNTTKVLSTETSSDRTYMFNTLMKIYDEQYRPPDIMMPYIDQKSFDKYANKATIYTTSNLSDTVIQRMCTEREPVNIGMKRYYDIVMMRQIFGYDISYYQRYWMKTGKLGPNLGVYTYAPVIYEDKYYDLHFYHAIGYAFDNKEQPDYKVLLSSSTSANTNTNTKIDTLIKLYSQVFECIFQCALHQDLSHIMMSVVGGGVFSALFIGGPDNFQKQIWVPAFESIAKKYPQIIVNFMGVDTKDTYMWAFVREEYLRNKKYENMGSLPLLRCGRFPGFLKDPGFQKRSEKTLIVNSWDPHSFPGNGNKGDNSLDGWIGRHSLIQFFGSGLTNPGLLKNIHRVQVL